ncbi:hypothetical protein KI387_007526, partial [Taxus chinensis]
MQRLDLSDADNEWHSTSTVHTDLYITRFATLIRENPIPQSCTATNLNCNQMEANGFLSNSPAINMQPSQTGGLNKRRCAVSFGETSAKRKNAIVAEQLRRNLMKYQCAELKSLIQPALSKVDRCGLYEEAGNYIRKLQDEVSQLKHQRDHLRALKQEDCGNTVKENTEVCVEVCGREAVIVITSIRKPRCHSKVIEEVEQHGLEVNMSQLCTSEFFVYVFFHAKFREDMKEHDESVRLIQSLQR